MTANEADRVPSSGTHVPVRRWMPDWDGFMCDVETNDYAPDEKEVFVRGSDYDALAKERDSLRADAERLDFVLKALVSQRINGEVTYYSIAHSLHLLRGCTNEGMLRAAIDAAIAATTPSLPDTKERG